MPNYQVRYVHKISPSEKDVAGPIKLSLDDLATKKSLAAALRRERILPAGDTIRSFRIEDDKVIAFPQASIWHSIILHLPGTAALPPKKTGPDTYQKFTVKIYPEGHRGSPTSQYFRTSSATTWSDARDRLIAAGVVKASLAGRSSEAGGWMLSVAPSDYRDDRAKPLP